MKFVSFVFASIVSVVSFAGCDDTVTTINKTTTTSVDAGAAVEQNIVPEPTVKESSVNVTSYKVLPWNVSVSDLWEIQDPPIDQVKLFFVNKKDRLVFSVLQEEIKMTTKEYVLEQVNFMRSLGLKSSDPKQVTINGFKYDMIECPESNFNNWQWILVDEKVATVWSCGGPSGESVNFEDCMTVMTTVKK